MIFLKVKLLASYALTNRKICFFSEVPALLVCFTLACLSCLCLIPFGWAQVTPGQGEEIETLDVIEVTGAAVEHAPREFSFPLPEFLPLLQPTATPLLAFPDIRVNTPREQNTQTLLDPTAKTHGIYTPVAPLKTDHPPYPRRARNQGWEGKVILQLHIDPQGRVESANVQQSSGYTLLDASALQTVQEWAFAPAKNGEFPIASTVNIPIKFDLTQ